MHATQVVATEAVDIHVVFDEQMASPRALTVDCRVARYATEDRLITVSYS